VHAIPADSTNLLIELFRFNGLCGEVSVQVGAVDV
jgi:hypothetical protein